MKLQDGPWPAARAGWPKGQGPPVGVPPAAGPAPPQGDRPRPLGPGWAAELWWEGLSPPGGPRPPEPGAHAWRPDGQHARPPATQGQRRGVGAESTSRHHGAPRRTGRARPLPRSGVPSACSLGPGECHPWRLPLAARTGPRVFRRPAVPPAESGVLNSRRASRARLWADCRGARSGSQRLPLNRWGAPPSPKSARRPRRTRGGGCLRGGRATGTFP